MHLAVVCPHFAPDLAPTGEVMTRIVTELASRGHRLDVITSLPWYLHTRVEPEWDGRPVRTELVPWGRITRVHPFPADKRSIPRRAAAFGAFSALTAALGSRGGRVDAVIAMSPPLTLGVTGWLVARARRAPLVFNVQDVFPDVAVELGVLTDPRVVGAARSLERFCYARADAVTVLSDDLRRNLQAKVADPAKVRVIPNFVDTDAIRPGPRDNAYRAEHDLLGRTVVMYAGNVGFSQSLQLLVETARRTQGRPDVVYVVNGGGSALDALRKEADGLANVRFVGYQPKERLGEVLAAADVHVVPLRRGLAASSVPSKTYSVLAAGRPLVASVDEGTEVARLCERSGAGLAVPPDDLGAFSEAVWRLCDDAAERRRRGEAGRRFVETWASPAAVAQAYEELVAELAAARRGTGARAGRG